MDRELDQTLQRNLERLYNYLENPEREEAQRVLLAAEPEPIRITHGIPDLYTDWLSSPSYWQAMTLPEDIKTLVGPGVGLRLDAPNFSDVFNTIKSGLRYTTAVALLLAYFAAI